MVRVLGLREMGRLGRTGQRVVWVTVEGEKQGNS